MERVKPANRPRFKSLIIDIVYICFLAAAAIKFTQSMAVAVDIDLNCESGYLYNGVNLTGEGHFNVQYGPLYIVWYYFLSLFEKNNIHLFYLNYKLLVVSTTLGLYFYLRRLKVVAAISAIAAFLYLFFGICLIIPWHALLALLILLSFFALSTFTKSETGGYCTVGIGILAASFARPEYTLAFILFWLGGLLLIRRKFRQGLIRPKSDLPKILLLLLLTLTVFSVFGNPLSGDRSWVTFGHHFAVNYKKWHNLPIKPWYDYPEVASRVFGAANNIAGAAVSNSREFLRHISTNAAGYFAHSLHMLFADSLQALLRLPRWLLRGIELLLFGIAAAYLFKNRLKILKGPNRTRTKQLLIFGAILVAPALLSGILIYPNKRYFLVQGAMIIILFSYAVSSVMANKVRVKRAKLLLALLLGALILFLTPSMDRVGSAMLGGMRVRRGKLPNVKTIRFIRELNIGEEVNILGAGGGHDIYIGNNYQRVTGYEKETSFNKLMGDYEIGMIVLSKKLRGLARFTRDSVFEDFVNDPRPWGFVKMEIPGTKRLLFIRGVFIYER